MEHHNTFTWYDYPTKRNRRIALKRYLIAALIIGGIVIWAIV